MWTSRFKYVNILLMLYCFKDLIVDRFIFR